MNPMKKVPTAPVRPDLKPLLHQTKTQALRDRLIALVGTMEPHEKLPTMQKLQQMLEVSPMTLHRALSELEAHQLIYRRQGSGTYVAPLPENTDRVLDSVPTIGLVYDRDIFGAQASPFGSILVEEARRRAAEHGERFSLYLSASSGEDAPVHDDLREAVELGRLRGVLYAGESNPRALNWLLEHKVAVVSLSYLPVATHRVQIDHAELVRLGARALAEKGCRRIGLWIPLGVGIGRRDGENSFPELDAFRQTLEEQGLEFDPKDVWRQTEHTDQVSSSERETNQAQGLRAAREVFGKKKSESSTRLPLDGLVIDDDMMTRGALTFLSKKGVRIGEELHIATHCNRGSDVLLGHEDELSLIEVDPSEISAAMLEMLETLMRGEKPLNDVVEIEPKLRS